MICIITEKRKKQKNEVVNFVLKRGQEKLFGSIIEDSNKKILKRVSFDDSEIINLCNIDMQGKSVTYSNPNNTFTTVYIATLMCRQYLAKASDNSSKWFFRTVKLFRPVEKISTKQIMIKLASQKLGIQIFDFFIDDEYLGQGYAAAIPIDKLNQ